MASNNEIRSLERTLATLLNKQLQQICATNGLRTSGVKLELQNRIKNALIENYHSDPATFAHMRNSIENFRPGGASSSSNATHSAMSSSTSQPHSNGYGHGQGTRSNYPYHSGPPPMQASGYSQGNYNNYSAGHAAGGYRGHPQSLSDLHFKASPFYVVEAKIGDIPMSQHRNSINIPLKVNDYPLLSRCANNKSMRVMLFCAGDNQGVQDIAFPHQSEIKVNGGEIKANLRGLKGKPGSTRPVDITDSLRLKQYNYMNNVEFTYALTTKVKKTNPSYRGQKFYLGLYLCKAIPVEDLVGKIRGKKIAKNTVVQELSRAANDPDVVATSQVLSLRCPLSYTRLMTPCRSILCSHIQCFDANSYLQLQEQGPQWVCPVCNKPAPFENLAVDEYVRDILENTSESQEQVTIEPDGQWRTQAGESEPRRSRYSGNNAKAEADDDISILSDSRAFNGTTNRQFLEESSPPTPSHSMFNIATPSGASTTASREPSSVPRSGNGKRPAEVIDLTLSSDEDDEPIVRAPKRQNYGQGFDDGDSLFPSPFGY
ncbi:hypothetical protein DL765_009219 [Monosporascus sp. GIB2]|nr:hypothetical protein DL765_009219 [Monosporascus sp. GIB2]